MRLRLDTNIVIRLRQDERRIDRTTRHIIESAAAVYVSAASIWEIAIKASARKLAIDLERLKAGLLEARIKPLPITWTHARRAHNIALSRRSVRPPIARASRLRAIAFADQRRTAGAIQQ
jgi:PIN domain nuclease of toxin-antitoxin system